MYLSIIAKNLNWEMLTKNLVTFKRQDGVKDEKFQYYGNSLKNLIFRGGGGGHKKPIYKGRLPEKGVWTVCKFKGEGYCEKEGVVVLSGG